MGALARLIASGLGSGWAPFAPGTVASLVALVAGALLLAWWPPALPVAALVAVAAGLWSIPASGASGDPGWVVIDEVAGQWIAMLPLRHPHWLALLVALALFRLFDIAKPGPVGWVDRHHGPVAVMADDVVAGALAALLLWLAGLVAPEWLAL